jgi:hypothetical protein
MRLNADTMARRYYKLEQRTAALKAAYTGGNLPYNSALAQLDALGFTQARAVATVQYWQAEAAREARACNTVGINHGEAARLAARRAYLMRNKVENNACHNTESVVF